MIISKNIIMISLVLFLVFSSNGGIISGNTLKIDFTNPKEAKEKATWFPATKINLTKDGIGFEGQTNSVIDAWIKTKPLAIGLSWRPASSASLSVSISPKPKEITLPNGQKSMPSKGSVFVRYSPDMKNWSSWIAVNDSQSQKQDNKAREYFLRIGIPRFEREHYSNFLMAYSKLDVPWKSDEEAVVKWILKKEPEFFSKTIPFIGYVEFLFEGRFTGGQRIKSLNVSTTYALSGIHQSPKNKEAWKGREREPWRFKAEERTIVKPE